MAVQKEISQALPEGYRSISVRSIVDKIDEKYSGEQNEKFIFNINQLVSSKQIGFRQNRPASDQLPQLATALEQTP